MIYLDHAAATPMSERVLAAMGPYLAEEFFNPSAAYLPAKKVAAEYEAAKGVIAQAIGAKGTDLVITGSATEANNLAFTSLSLDGSCRRLLPREDVAGGPLRRHHPSMLYLETEHDSVREVANQYGGAAIRVLPSGLVDLADLKSKITDETELVSIALVNNELGTIQPLAEVSAMLREMRLDRMRRGVKRQLLLHSDASQALNLLDINVARLGVDLLTLNAAKIYGPKGVGALYVSHEARLRPLTYGGGQENGLRSGTENVPGVIGFAAAVTEAKKHLKSNRKKYAEMKQILLSELQGYELVNKKHSLDNFAVLCYNYLDGERLVFALEERGVLIATGAACAANKRHKSHVLAAIGLTESEINGTLRITLGALNDAEQMREAARIINEVVAAERERING